MKLPSAHNATGNLAGAARHWILLSLLAIASTASAAQPPADLVFVGKHILTMEGDAPARSREKRALAVTGEQISWIGAAKDAASYTGPDTRVIELGRRALLPGFIDAHGHLTFQAATINMANVASPPVGPVRDIKSLISTLQDYVAEQGGNVSDWVIGFGYDDSLLTEGKHPTRRDLDQVSADRPIALLHVSGHLIAANSPALALAGINADTDDPAGGHIRRFADSNEPNGVLEETAMYPVRGFLFSGQTDPIAGVKAAMAYYASQGITTVQDGATAAAGVELIQAADAAGALDLDVLYYPVVTSAEPIPEHWYLGRYRNRAKAVGVKMMLDGSPQGKTAFLSKPYHVPPTGKDADYRGYPTHPPEHVTAMVGHYLDAGVPILAHANGDAAADLLIDAVAQGDHKGDHRTVMIHAQGVRYDQLDDMAQLRMIPSFFSAHSFYWGDWHRDSVFGPERGARISPARSALDRGLTITTHNDAPVVPPDMVRLLWATSNRKTRSGKTLGADERISPYEALVTMTRSAAYQSFEETRKGTLSVGKLADLVVLSRNPLQLRPGALLDLKVMGTWSHGRQVYDNTRQ